MVLPDSCGVSRVPQYSGSVPEGDRFRLQGCYLLWPVFPEPLHLSVTFLTPYGTSCNPDWHCQSVWAVPVSLAATQGIAFAFSSSGYLDVSVPLVCLLPSYGFRWRYQFFQLVGCPIRRSSDQSLLTAPRGISVFVPSFIGSWRQGIHRVPLVAYPTFLLFGDYFSR